MPPSYLLHVRVPEADMIAWDEGAERHAGGNLSEYVRQAVRRWQEEEKQAARTGRAIPPGFRMG